MEREIDAVLRRLGRAVTVENPGEEPCVVQALIQPIRDKGEDQSSPTPLGILRKDRFLYLGQAHVPLRDGGSVAEDEARYQVVSAHPIRSGGQDPAYWWAILRPEAGEETT